LANSPFPPTRSMACRRDLPNGGLPPVDAQEAAAKDSVVGAVLGGGKLEDVILAGMNPQHAIVTGLGASPTDSVGYPWNARYTIASGNLLADFRFNLTAESQGRLQVTRLYALTEDPGVRDIVVLPDRAGHDAPEPVTVGHRRT
jgi:Mn-containing catalase